MSYCKGITIFAPFSDSKIIKLDSKHDKWIHTHSMRLRS